MSATAFQKRRREELVKKQAEKTVETVETPKQEEIVVQPTVEPAEVTAEKKPAKKSVK